MAPTAADFLLERLRAWDVRHQEMAAFEAVGYAQFTESRPELIKERTGA